MKHVAAGIIYWFDRGRGELLLAFVLALACLGRCRLFFLRGRLFFLRRFGLLGGRRLLLLCRFGLFGGRRLLFLRRFGLFAGRRRLLFLCRLGSFLGLLFLHRLGRLVLFGFLLL